MKRFVQAMLLAVAAVTPLAAAPASTHHETIEWTWIVEPASIDDRLPNVLLVGDSITRNYYADVATALTGRANVFLFSTSASVGDARLAGQIADYGRMIDRHFAVVHFNNGMHAGPIPSATMPMACRHSSPRYRPPVRAPRWSGRRPRRCAATRPAARPMRGSMRATPPRRGS